MGPDDAPADPTDAAGELLVVCFNAARTELLGTLAHVLGSREAALDVAQETFLKCWRARHTTTTVVNLRAWVFKVALNAARDAKKSAWTRKAKPLAAETTLTATDFPPAAALEQAETLARLRAAIAQLRPEEQEVFLLRQNGGLTYDEIAEQRGTPVGTIKTQMRSALQKLRRAMMPTSEPISPNDFPGAAR